MAQASTLLDQRLIASPDLTEADLAVLSQVAPSDETGLVTATGISVQPDAEAEVSDTANQSPGNAIEQDDSVILVLMALLVAAALMWAVKNLTP